MKNLSRNAVVGILVSGIMLSVVGVVFAQPALIRPGVATNSAIGALTPVQQQRVSNLKAKADTEITRRLTTLNNLLNRINASTRLASAERTSLTTIAQNEITNLTSLKAKIDADTDLVTLRADVKSIVDDYRVYLLVVPQTGLTVVADTILMNADRMIAISIKLEQRLAASPNADAQTALADLNKQISDAKTLANGVVAAVLPLTPQGYPANKTTLTTSRTNLIKARDDLKKGRDDIRAVLRSLRADKSASSSATGSAVVR